MPDTSKHTTQVNAQQLVDFLGARRETKLVAFLTGPGGLGGRYKSLLDHPRVANLPGMLRRHGLLQTMMFLESKGKGNGEEKLLLELLGAAVKEYSGRPLPGFAELPEDPLQALYLQAHAIEAAVWIRQVAAAYQVRPENDDKKNTVGDGDATGDVGEGTGRQPRPEEGP